MKKGDKALSPQITYTGAKTFITAQVGAVLGMEAYATDTFEKGIYDGSVWQWTSVTGSAGGGTSDHEALTGLLGGIANNHYHLTPNQVIGLVSGTSTTLHSHAGLYTGTFIWDEGILKGVANTLNFVGVNTDVSVSGSVARVFITGSYLPHNSLSGLQGGVSNEFYHLTATQVAGLVSGSSTTLHTHPTGTILHEALTDLLGGSANNHYHLTPSQVTGLVSGTSTTLHTHAGIYTGTFYTGTFAWDEGILKGNVNTLNFVGNGVDVSVSGSVARVFISGSNNDHNTLTGIQGGASNNYYHLTQAQMGGLTTGSNTGLHHHALQSGTAYVLGGTLNATGSSYTFSTPDALPLSINERWYVKWFNSPFGSGAPTLNRDGRGAKPLKLFDAYDRGNANNQINASSASLISGTWSDVIYDGASYIVLEPSGAGYFAAVGGSASNSFLVSSSIGNQNSAVNVATIQNQSLLYFVATGTSTAYTFNTTATPSVGYNIGEKWSIKFHVTAGATPTLNRDGKGAKSLKFYDSTGTKQSCGASTIIANMVGDVFYDGTDYVILDPIQALPAWTSYTPTWTQTATITKTIGYAKYLQNGKMVWAQGVMTATSAGTASGQIKVSLPVTAATASSYIVFGTANFEDASPATSYNLSAYPADVNTLTFLGDTTAGNVFGVVPAITVASGDYISWSIFYEAA